MNPYNKIIGRNSLPIINWDVDTRVRAARDMVRYNLSQKNEFYTTKELIKIWADHFMCSPSAVGYALHPHGTKHKKSKGKGGKHGNKTIANQLQLF